THQLLSPQDCQGALALILPVYGSTGTDNDVRMLTASAYSCYAGVNFFKLIGDLNSNSSRLADRQFWGLLTQLFPSAAGDRKAEYTSYAIEALQSVIPAGTTVPPASQINPGTPNIGSIYSTDRSIDSNEYLTFVAMAAIGTYQNRYGTPNPATFVKTVNLPWTTAAALTPDGCAYASAIVNFSDALDVVTQNTTGVYQQLLMGIKTNFQATIYTACDRGCQNSNPGGGWVPSGCTVTTACATCPIGLRDRNRCTGQNNDQVSCAAAGIVNFINTDLVFGWN
ncbi:MAG: hypothetical protein AABZ55_14650, partial [Bdellovibrionota bacterium]